MNASIPTYRLYGESAEENADFWLHFEDLPSRSRPYRWEIGAHRHGDFFQIFTISKGGGELLTDEGVQQFAAPAAIVIPTGAVHGFRFAHESDGMVLTIRADRLDELKRADRLFAFVFDKPRVFPLADNSAEILRAGEGLSRIGVELSGHGAGRMTLVGALLVDVLVHLARSAAANMSETLWGEGRDSARMQQLVEIIDGHFRENKPVAFYAGRLGISPTHLNRLARLHFGESVQALIDRKRIEQARRELVFTPFPAQAIAFSLGFSDPAYFNRFFRKKTGMTPGRYRAAQLQKAAR